MKTVKIILVVLLIACLMSVVLIGCSRSQSKVSVLAELSVSERFSYLDYSSEYPDDDRIEEYLAATEKMTRFVHANELNLPSELTDPNNDCTLGLFVYDGEKFVPYTDPSVANIISPDKKTLVYAHGMGKKYDFPNCKGYFENGYNVVEFYWDAFSSVSWFATQDDPSSFVELIDEIWFSDAEYKYRTPDGADWVYPESFPYTVTEIFAAYYLDFFQKYGCTTKEIVIGGHSYGGTLMMAVLSYLTTAFKNGLLDAVYLPDRAILCDPFVFSGFNSNLHVSWLGNTQNDYYGGAIYLSRQAFVAANKLGISVALFRSSELVSTSIYMSYPDLDVIPDELDKFHGELLFLKGYALSILDPTGAHRYAAVWPGNVMHETFEADHPTEYAYSLFNPYYEEFARTHETFTFDYSDTAADFDDDKITLTREKNKIFGFAFLDENGNELLDERLASHLAGVTVTLKDKDGKTLATQKTGANGYFEFNVDNGEYMVSAVLANKKEASKSVTADGASRFLFVPFAQAK